MLFVDIFWTEGSGVYAYVAHAVLERVVHIHRAVWERMVIGLMTMWKRVLSM